MAERIMEWTVPFDGQVHPIGWGQICFFRIDRGFQGLVYTQEDEETVSQARPVRLYRTDEALPELSEHLCSDEAPGGAVLHLVAVDDGANLSTGEPSIYSTSSTGPEGTLIASIVPEPGTEETVDYPKVLSGAIEHMRFLLATGVQG